MATGDACALSSSGAAGLQGDSAGGSASTDGEHQHRDLSVELLEVLQREGAAVDSAKLKVKVDELTVQRQEVKLEEQRVTAQLQQRQDRQRIRKRTQYSSNEDLVDVLAVRKSKTNAAVTKSKAKSPGVQAAPEAKTKPSRRGPRASSP